MITKTEWKIAADAMDKWPRFMFAAHTVRNGIDNGVVIPDLRSTDITMSPAVAILQSRLGGNVILPRSEIVRRLFDLNEAIREQWEVDHNMVGTLAPYQIEWDTKPGNIAEWMRRKWKEAG